MNNAISNCVDMGMDSYYPLVTEDPEKQREYTIKIPQNIPATQLNRVFDPQNKDQFNLQSIYINDNYVPDQNIGKGQIKQQSKDKQNKK